MTPTRIVEALLEADDNRRFCGIVVLRNPSEPEVLLILRGGPPEEGKWACPGGHVEEDEDFEDGAKRELKEETGIETDRVQFFAQVPATDREGMVHYYFTVVPEDLKVHADDDAEKFKWSKADEVKDLAFDCENQIKGAVERAFATGSVAESLARRLIEGVS